MGMITYGFRLLKIFKNDNKYALFSLSEMVSAIVNLKDAENNLKVREYMYVLQAYSYLKRKKEKRYMNKKIFLEFADLIMADFDMVVPLYRFCGNTRMSAVMLADEENKYEYRERAKKILMNNGFYGKEWESLRREFIDEFYS